jgi:Polyketide cyclase / dehydrase and lipid transport
MPHSDLPLRHQANHVHDGLTSVPDFLRTATHMSVDVLVETTIDRAVAIVAAYAGDPSNAPRWYRRINRADWVTEPPARIGSRIAFRAKFLGKALVYTYEFVELTPEHSLTMRTAEGPFPMETTYTWTAAGDAATKMTLRNRGEPAGFSKLTAPLMSAAMKRAMAQDLRQLKIILESA